MDFVYAPTSLGHRQLRSGGGRRRQHTLRVGQLPPSSRSIDVYVRLGSAHALLYQHGQSQSIVPTCLVATDSSLQAHQSSYAALDSSEASLTSSHRPSTVAKGGIWLRLLLCATAYLLCDHLPVIVRYQLLRIAMAIYHRNVAMVDTLQALQV